MPAHAKASPVPKSTLMQQVAPTAAISDPATPRDLDRWVIRLDVPNTKHPARRMKQSAVVGAMRPGPEALVAMYVTPRSSSIPKLAWKKNSRSVAAAKDAAMAEQANVSRDLFITIPRRASPLSTKLAAVFRCIGARLGATRIRNVELTAQPTSTTDPSRIASTPHSVPILLETVMAGDFIAVVK